MKKTLIQAAHTPQSSLQEVRNLRVQDHSCKKFGRKGKQSGELREEQNQRVFPFLFGKIKGPEQFHRGGETKFLDKTRKLAPHSASSIRTELFKDKTTLNKRTCF